MKERIKAFFTTNIMWKVLSLLGALLLWTLILNVQDPLTTLSLEIPIRYENKDTLVQNDEVIFLSGPETATINVSVTTKNRSEVKPEFFVCTADVTKRTGGDLSNQSVRIDVKQVDGENIVTSWSYLRNDPYITVSMDNYISKEFPVQMVWNDDVAALKPEEVVFSPATVTISGAASKFANLAAVNVPMTLSDLTQGQGGEFNVIVPVKLYDANNNVLQNLKDFQIDNPTVSMTAKISNVKTVDLVLTGTPEGKLPEDCFLISTTCKKTQVTVFGLKQIGISELSIPLSDLDITGLEKTKDFKVDIMRYLPTGLHVSEEDRYITVTAEIENADEKEFKFSTITVKGLAAGLKEALTPGTEVPFVIVKGKKDVLSGLRAEDFEATADFTGLAAGEHTVQITVKTPEGVTVTNAELSAHFTLTETGAEPEPTKDADSQN